MTEPITLNLTLKELQLIDKYVEKNDDTYSVLMKIKDAYPRPKMNFLFDGKFEVVSYNKQSYYRFEFPDEVYWYRRISDETCLDLKLVRITDGETHRLLEGLWFNEVKGNYDADEPYCPDEPEHYDEVEWDEKDNPKPMDEVVDKMLKEWEENPPEFLKFEMGKTLEALITRWWCDVFTKHDNWDMETAIDDLIDQIQLWLPKEQSAAGSQNVYVECSVEGFNDCLTKIKNKLRNKK
jgi:hypothetical protein